LTVTIITVIVGDLCAGLRPGLDYPTTFIAREDLGRSDHTVGSSPIEPLVAGVGLLSQFKKRALLLANVDRCIRGDVEIAELPQIGHPIEDLQCKYRDAFCIGSINRNRSCGGLATATTPAT